VSKESNLTQLAHDRLRADLLACRLKPGERLIINQLCQYLDVSLGAVREALSRLSSEGLVIAEPQRGFRVAPISAEDLKDLTAVRLEIELLCLKDSIANGDIQWEAGLVAAQHLLARTPTKALDDPCLLSEAYATAHRRFHEALVAACKSFWLLKLRALLYDQSERYRRLSIPLADHERELNSEHKAIMEAALERDVPRAASLLSTHLERTSQILLHTAIAQRAAPDKKDSGKKGREKRDSDQDAARSLPPNSSI
jgi:DNA-binding GntR family transcriptional regulator